MIFIHYNLELLNFHSEKQLGVIRIIEKNYSTNKCIILITPRYVFWIENVVILNYDECKSLTLRSKIEEPSSKHAHAQKLVLF